MGNEIDEKSGMQSGGAAHLGDAIDEIYQVRKQSQFTKHPEAAPIDTSQTTRSFINQTWKTVGEPLIKGINDWSQRLDNESYLDFIKGTEKTDKPKSPWKDVDLEASKTAYSAFPVLAEHNIPESMIAGIILNEIRHGGDPTDPIEDLSVQMTGTVRNPDGTEKTTASVGPAQIQIGNIRELVQKYPQLSQFKDDPVRAAVDPSTAPFFVAAYLAQHIEKLEEYNRNHLGGQIDITPGAVAYTYNPDVFSSPGATQLKQEDYKAATAADKVDAYLTRKPSAALAGWKPEGLPLNDFIVRASGTVHDIFDAMKSIDRTK